MRARTTTAVLAGALLLAGCSTNDAGSTSSSAAVTPAASSTDTTVASSDAAGASSADAAATSADSAASSGDAAAASSGAGDAASATTGAAAVDASTMTDPVCKEFFTAHPKSLGQRAEETLAQLQAGEVKDPATWGQMNLLSQRLSALAAKDGDAAALVKRINAPFLEGSKAVLNSSKMTPSDPEITLPKIDVTDAKAAAEELITTCQG